MSDVSKNPAGRVSVKSDIVNQMLQMGRGCAAMGGGCK